MIKKLIYKIQNKELLTYIKWKLKKYQRNPFLETKLNIFKLQLNKSEENPKSI